VTIKSVYSYEFTRIHGATGHLNARYFTDAYRHAAIIKKANDQRDRRHAHEAYLKHFIDDLQQDIPLWAYVDLLTISDISFLYSITEVDIQKSVASDFGLRMSKGNCILGAFLHSMTIIRNLCAHGGRLFNRLFEQKPSLNKYEKTLLIQMMMEK
jgi:abortive infection bacteriophage resistance protein